jgi:high-affinity iron transporter
MLPTFVIGLREGLEAALIVGIIAAFLSKQGRRDLLRWVAVGITAATLLCVAVGVVLDVVSRNLPQKQQEGLETVVGALAVGMVTYMVIWMRRNSRELKGSLEEAAATALEEGDDRAGRAMVAMAFLAVLREGFETVVFLLAAFNEAGSGTDPVVGAILGILIAVGLGYGIYRGGVRINLSKFFRATGLVLVFVAAGLVLTAFHTAHEAGWLNFGQQGTVDLTWLVHPGSVQSSLLTGILGIQPHPVVIEAVGWLVYLIPVGLYVGWPPGKGLAPRRLAAWCGVGAVATAIAAVALVTTLPTAPYKSPAVAGLKLHGVSTVDGFSVEQYQKTTSTPTTGSYPTRLSDARVAALNGGRLPLGVTAGGGGVAATYSTRLTTDVDIDAASGQTLDTTTTRQVEVTVHAGVGAIPLATPIEHSVTKQSPAMTAAADAKARQFAATVDRRQDRISVAEWMVAATVGLLLAAAVAGVSARRGRRRSPATSIDTPAKSVLDTQVSLT